MFHPEIFVGGAKIDFKIFDGAVEISTRTFNLKQDNLYNDILTFCEQQHLLWKADEINTLGVSFV